VTARSSAFQFKGKEDDGARGGKALDVATVLEGSVRKAGNRVRISVQLVKCRRTARRCGPRATTARWTDIFAVQDDIAQSVVKELRATLLGDGADSGRERTCEGGRAPRRRRGAPPIPRRIGSVSSTTSARSASTRGHTKAIEY
jgi:hypothetical protein